MTRVKGRAWTILCCVLPKNEVKPLELHKERMTEHRIDCSREEEVREAVQGIIKQHGLDDDLTFHSTTRATGVHALSSATIMSATFCAYWRTGVVAGNKIDCSALQQDHGGHANPLLYVSSAPLGQFAVHYGTDPLHGFHLAEVFDAPGEGQPMMQRLASTAKSRFRDWCAQFKKHLRKGGVRMFFHCGEAVSLSYELQRQSSGSVGVPAHLHTYSRPWSSLCLDLGLAKRQNASCHFDVIDTSNISDHVGILNLLPAVQPLFKNNFHSVLYTETLLRAAAETTGYLDELLRIDVGSFGIIAGIAPTTSLLGITSEHFGCESFLDHYGRKPGSQSQLRVRIPWKRPSGGDNLAAPFARPIVSASAGDLADLLFKWYLNIFFAFENLDIQLSVHLRRALTPLSHDLNHYTRTTLVALICLARMNVHTDWSECIGLLVDKIQDDKTMLVGSNSWQELNVLLHISGLYGISALTMSPSAAAMNFSAIADCLCVDALPEWPEMSSVVAVALIVPRDKLQALTSADLNRIGTPSLHLAIYSDGTFENSFHCIHACFGRLTVADGGETSAIEEDALGWRGHAELIITCLVPAFQFRVRGRGETRAGLVINSSTTNAYFIHTLGPRLRLLTTATDERQNFRVLPRLPGVRRSEQAPLPHPHFDGQRTEPDVSMSLMDGRLELLTLRQNFPASSDRDHLQNGLDVKTIQENPCTITVQLNKIRTFRFPFPVDGYRCKTRIARKQLWIELVVPISFATSPNGHTLLPFPVVSQLSQPMVWGISRINLIKSPIMADMSLKRLSSFLAMTLSTRERNAQPDPARGQEFSRSFFEIKESLTALFTSFASQDNSSGRRWKAFRLAVQNDSDTLIFANSLRHDHDLGSICLDAHVVPLTSQRIQTLSQLLANTMGPHQVLGIKISKREEVLWKHVLPAFVDGVVTLGSISQSVSTSRPDGDVRSVLNMGKYLSAHVAKDKTPRIFLMNLLAFRDSRRGLP